MQRMLDQSHFCTKQHFPPLIRNLSQRSHPHQHYNLVQQPIIKRHTSDTHSQTEKQIRKIIKTINKYEPLSPPSLGRRMFHVQLFFRAWWTKASRQLPTLFTELCILCHAPSETMVCFINLVDRTKFRHTERGVGRYLTPSAVQNQPLTRNDMVELLVRKLEPVQNLVHAKTSVGSYHRNSNPTSTLCRGRGGPFLVMSLEPCIKTVQSINFT